MKTTALLALAVAACGAQPAAVTLYYERGTPESRFAAGEIRRALAEGGAPLVEAELDAAPAAGDTRILLVSGAEKGRRLARLLGMAPPGARAPQSYALRKRVEGRRATYAVLGADAAGAMYGGLDLAEAIRLGTLAEVRDGEHSPYIARRGIKFNIPLDARTPSYSDSGDAAQQNIPEMWSFDFWREFLDEMARHRYNVLSLWSLHPFPSLVKVPEYPEVALDDVKRTRVKLDDTFSFTGSDMVRPEMLRNLETVRTISIGEKIRFWRDVMQYAHDRAIEVYLFTWNIFTWGAEGKYGITSAQDNPTTIDYFRKSVRETVLTYPLLAGMGITAGEQMRERADGFSKERWLWQTYGEGIRDALKLDPRRRFRLIHRYHQTELEPVLEAFKEYPGTLDLSYKYSVAHMYSSPAPVFAKPMLEALPARLRVWMTVRNDDIYNFRWGDPEYARAYIRNLPGPDKLAGFYMGPDGTVWGREVSSTEPETPRELVIRKQWYSFMLWGRLSYDPKVPDALFERTLARRYPEAPPAKLFEACARASRIIPQVTRFFWGDIDLKWFPEACLSHPRHRGFYTVRHFMEGQAMPGAGVVNIAQYSDGVLSGKTAAGMTPPQVAAALEDHARAALRLVAEMRRPGQAEPLRLLLGDVEAMARLGEYYAEKIRGATELALFDRTGAAPRQAAAVAHLESALGHWKEYAETAGRQYRPQLFNRVGYVDLAALTAKVDEDIGIARGWRARAR